MRRRIIIVAVAFLVLVGGGVAVLFAVKNSPSLQNAVYKATNTVPTTNTTSTNSSNVNRVITSPDREAVTLVTRNFSERYGSYSNQNNGSNLEEAKAYATPTYATFLQSQITAAKVAPPAKEYVGVVTKALVFSILRQTTTAAQVLVSTQQQVATGTTVKTQSKGLLIDLVKIDSAWKVNSAVWK